MINPGDKVEDKITGFTGTAVCRTVYLNGCIRIGVLPKVLDSGKQPETEWIDERQLQVITNGKEKKRKETGGDRPSPKDLTNPKNV